MAEAKSDAPEVTRVAVDNRRMRFLYMVIFVILAWAALWLIVFLATLQFVLSWITGSVNTNLRGFAGKLGDYFHDMLDFLGFVTDVVPFPFSPMGMSATTTTTTATTTDAAAAPAPAKPKAPRRKPAPAKKPAGGRGKGA